VRAISRRRCLGSENAIQAHGEQAKAQRQADVLEHLDFFIRDLPDVSKIFANGDSIG
jgi:hypothetical protein